MHDNNSLMTIESKNCIYISLDVINSYILLH